MDSDAGLTRRSFVGAAGALGLLSLAPPARVAGLLEEALAAPASRGGRYLRAHELDTLRAVVGRLIPGPPDDPQPGAREAGAAEAIDLLLGAFSVHPPLIVAGGPFSGRAGGRRDDFAHFVELDDQAALGWRIRIEGSRGRRGREFGGPVRGLQEVYRSGLAHLDARAHARFGLDFAQLPGPLQEAVLREDDPATAELVDTALGNALEATYGPPEYGGNRGRVGWTSTGWQGDTQPRGFPANRVSHPDVAQRALDPAAARRVAERVAGALRR
jgi:hypothetical protein